MAAQSYEMLNFSIGYFLTPLFFLLLGCTALKFWIPRAGDPEKVERRQSNTVGGSLLLLALLSLRALCVVYNGNLFFLKAQLAAGVPLVALNLLYLRYCSPQLKFWILYGVGVLYLSLHLYVDNLRIVNELYLIWCFLLIYLQVFLTGEVYAYVSRLLIEFVTSNPRLPDGRGAHTLITLSKYLLFYGYMGFAVIAVGLSTFVNGPLTESPVNIFLTFPFLPFFPDLHPFTKGLGELFSQKPALCIYGEGAPDLPRPNGRGVTLTIEPTFHPRTEDLPTDLRDLRSRRCFAISEAFGMAAQSEAGRGNSSASTFWQVSQPLLAPKTIFSCESTDFEGAVRKFSLPRPEDNPVAELFARNESLHEAVEDKREAGVIGSIKALLGHHLVSSVMGEREGAVTITVYEGEGPNSLGKTEG